MLKTAITHQMSYASESKGDKMPEEKLYYFWYNNVRHEFIACSDGEARDIAKMMLDEIRDEKLYCDEPDISGSESRFIAWI